MGSDPAQHCQGAAGLFSQMFSALVHPGGVSTARDAFMKPMCSL